MAAARMMLEPSQFTEKSQDFLQPLLIWFDSELDSSFTQAVCVTRIFAKIAERCINLSF